ncbi:unnamed protein product [Closterium sp. NIES-54]
MLVVEEEVGIGSAGSATAPNTSPSSALTAVTPTTTTPREAAGEVLGRAFYIGRVLYTDQRLCSAKSTTPKAEVVALMAIVSMMKSTPARWYAQLAHVDVDTITSSAKHGVATSLDIKPSADTDSRYVSCVGKKLARHTFPDKGSDAEDALAVMHINLCGPFRVAAKDGSLYFLLQRNRKTFLRVGEASRQEFRWDFLGKEFTAFVDGKGILHDLTCPFTPQQNGIEKWEMRTVVESVWTMLLHMGVQHH